MFQLKLLKSPIVKLFSQNYHKIWIGYKIKDKFTIYASDAFLA